MKLLATTLTALMLSFMSFSQGSDTVSMMFYNILNYPQINSSRISYLETINDYVKPDILVVSELTSLAGSNNILNQALNDNGIGPYEAMNYVSGPDDVNMLYFNGDILGKVSQREIATSLRNINEYVLYYKEPGMTASSDTVYLYVYALHLKAGNQDSDADQRAGQAAVLKADIVTNTQARNVFVGGDFNIYTSNEQAYFYMTNFSQANLHDVLGTGSYHNNSAFSPHFTQSTRTASFDGGSTGGMDDRFDMIFFSDDGLDGSNGVKYIPGTYEAIGQDGIRWNESLISPTNSSLPANIINALYYMSDHLPVYLEVEVGGTLDLEQQSELVNVQLYPNPTATKFFFETEANVLSWSLMDLQGRIVQVNDGTSLNQVDVSSIEAGTYMFLLETDRGIVKKKIIVQ